MEREHSMREKFIHTVANSRRVCTSCFRIISDNVNSLSCSSTSFGMLLGAEACVHLMGQCNTWPECG